MHHLFIVFLSSTSSSGKRRFLLLLLLLFLENPWNLTWSQKKSRFFLLISPSSKQFTNCYFFFVFINLNVTIHPFHLIINQIINQKKKKTKIHWRKTLAKNEIVMGHMRNRMNRIEIESQQQQQHLHWTWKIIW